MTAGDDDWKRRLHPGSSGATTGNATNPIRDIMSLWLAGAVPT